MEFRNEYKREKVKINGYTRRRRKGEAGRELKVTVAENFPNLDKELYLQVPRANRTLSSQCKKTFSRTHYYKTVKSH